MLEDHRGKPKIAEARGRRGWRRGSSLPEQDTAAVGSTTNGFRPQILKSAAAMKVPGGMVGGSLNLPTSDQTRPSRSR